MITRFPGSSRVVGSSPGIMVPSIPAQAPQDMATFVEAGITTFDCADIYTGVESMIGEFRARYPQLARKVRIHTKFVPDLQALETFEFRLCRAHDPPLVAAAADGEAGSRAVPLVGLRKERLCTDGPRAEAAA